MKVLIRETQEEQFLNYSFLGKNCAAEVIGAGNWQGFSKEDGRMVCDLKTFNSWWSYFENQEKANGAVKEFREVIGFNEEFEEELLSNCDSCSLEEVPNKMMETINNWKGELKNEGNLS